MGHGASTHARTHTRTAQLSPWGSIKARGCIWSVDSELGEQLAEGPGPTLGICNWASGRA
jgi:hypothetical protein